MILVDTTVWIDYLAGRETMQASHLDRLMEGREYLCTCGVVMTEVLQGIGDEREHGRTLEVLGDLIYLPMERDAFVHAARIYRKLRAKGITIRNSVDCMIAAVAMESGASLLHHDRDFDRIAAIFPLEAVALRGS